MFKKIKEWLSKLKIGFIINAIDDILIVFLDKLKTKSPHIWKALAVLFTAAFAAVNDPDFVALLPEAADATVLKWITFLAGLFSGMHTTEQKATRKAAKEAKAKLKENK